LKRNPNLLVLREQLADAVLDRSLSSGDTASVIFAYGKLKQPNGKTKNLQYTYTSAQAVKRIGYIQKVVDFGSVSSFAELKILAQRTLAFRLAPIRSAELTHPGVATLRSGDAIRIDLPEEGYAQVALNIDGKPAKPPVTGRQTYTAAELLAAEKSDPGIFGIFDPNALSANQQAGQSQSSYQQPTEAAQPQALVVADQSIAFVTSIQHTASAGTYTMDVQTGFTDMLDPSYVQDLVDTAQRSSKSGGVSASTAGGTLTMYDATGGTLNSIPSSPQAVASYIDNDGGYAASVTKFPNAKHLSITVVNPGGVADCVDCEPGGVTYANAGPWVKRMLALGRTRPCVYASMSNMDAVKNSLGAAGLSRSQYRLWVADWTGSAHIPAGYDACQYASNSNYDTSLLSSTFFG
jgi:hypothetical protein